MKNRIIKITKKYIQLNKYTFTINNDLCQIINFGAVHKYVYVKVKYVLLYCIVCMYVVF